MDVGENSDFFVHFDGIMEREKLVELTFVLRKILLNSIITMQVVDGEVFQGKQSKSGWRTTELNGQEFN